MNIEQAKEILALFRPGANDCDPSLSTALQMARNDPELGRWFEGHCASCAILREKFQSIPVPAALMEQILSERPARMPATSKLISLSFRKRESVLAIAAIILVLIVWGWRFAVVERTDEAGYRSYRNRMVSTATKAYRMALTTNDLQAVNAYLQQRHAPANYVLPKGLQKARAVGCAIVGWEGATVSMICFDSGRPLRPGVMSDLWLFVADHDAVRQAPNSGVPTLEQTDWVITASWSEGGKTYLLAAPGDKMFLQNYL